ncbi:hypothetical protein ACFX13_023545 [Malus domestica]|uniref:C2 domain-containing protein n=1 Tax=Malus domestica TaxID=3750 RepID=A0A498HJZ3_MALDO|nr:protein SRC2 homolog [Malus sylvestris]RXH69707.1 hypothetical protein DVH24_037491 [Malus domestica]
MESSRGGAIVEIKVVSCKDLKAFNFFQKLSVYALVSVQKDDNKQQVVVDQQKQMMNRTPTDKEGNGNPEWNHEMRFEFDQFDDDDDLFIQFDLRHEGVGLLGIGDRSIGEVRVPLKDLIRLQQQQDALATYVNYQVTTSDKKPNGILNFSYKLLNSKLPYKFEGSTGSHDVHDHQPLRIQYPTITFEDDDDDICISNSNISSAGYHNKFNSSTQVCNPASSLMELHQTHTSNAHYNYNPPPPPPVLPPADDHVHAYYLPPPPPPPPPHPPPPPPPMAEYNYLLPSHPTRPFHHPYHDYGPWRPEFRPPRPHGH